MNRRAAALTTNDGGLQEPRPDARRTVPRSGDILASERRARADIFILTIVSSGGEISVGRYAAAIERVRALARTRRVDGWNMCDHTHYARVASYRSHDTSPPHQAA